MWPIRDCMWCRGAGDGLGDVLRRHGHWCGALSARGPSLPPCSGRVWPRGKSDRRVAARDSSGDAGWELVPPSKFPPSKFPTSKVFIQMEMFQFLWKQALQFLFFFIFRIVPPTFATLFLTHYYFYWNLRIFVPKHWIFCTQTLNLLYPNIESFVQNFTFTIVVYGNVSF